MGLDGAGGAVRTVYLGTSAFAAAVLERLVAAGHAPALVVTRPDRPRGRGRRLASPPVAEAARALDLELSQPESVNADDARARIAACRPDAVCVCAFGALIREPLLCEHAMLNVHPSLLPRWRGAAPVERAIMAGDERTGVSIMRLVAELDAGPVCLQAGEPIGRDDTYGTLAARLQAHGARLLAQALDENPPFRDQDEAAVTYAEKIEATDRLLDPSRPADQVERVVRALAPHVGARLRLADGELLGVHEAVRLAGDAPAPGALADRDGRMVLGCASGALELLTVQPAGGRPMAGGAYLRGHPLPGGAPLRAGEGHQ